MEDREVITEFIKQFRDLPCLWDQTCEEYKDSTLKKKAWDILTAQLQKIDPAANVVTTKKKVDNLKFSYLREFKKVKESKKSAGSATSDIHVPSLWYYKLMTFLEKKNEVKRHEMDPLMEDEDDPQCSEKKRKKMITSERRLDLKKERLMDAAHHFLKTNTEPNAFGVYVGKTIEEIQSGQQRNIAEKLIVDVLFLARTSRLTLDTKIEIPSPQYGILDHYFAPSPQQCSNSSENSYNKVIITDQSPNQSSSHTEVHLQ